MGLKVPSTILRNSILRVVTWLGIDVVAVEEVFGRPGIGMLAHQAIGSFETPMIVRRVPEAGVVAPW